MQMISKQVNKYNCSNIKERILCLALPFSHTCMCMYIGCVCHVCAHMWVHAYGGHRLASSMFPSHFSFHLSRRVLFEFGVQQTLLVSIATVPEDALSLPPDYWITGRPPSPCQLLGGLGIWTVVLTFMWQSLRPPPQSFFQFDASCIWNPLRVRVETTETVLDKKGFIWAIEISMGCLRIKKHENKEAAGDNGRGEWKRRSLEKTWLLR